MEKQTIDAVQSTWKSVEAMGTPAAALFYDNLFTADPALKPLFKGNMEAQQQKLIQMLGAAVGKLNDLETLVPILQSLAKRHVSYGVKEADYATVGAAFLKTLEQGLGAAFTPQVKTAWTEVYGVMASVMISAAKA